MCANQKSKRYTVYCIKRTLNIKDEKTNLSFERKIIPQVYGNDANRKSAGVLYWISKESFILGKHKQELQGHEQQNAIFEPKKSLSKYLPPLKLT